MSVKEMFGKVSAPESLQADERLNSETSVMLEDRRADIQLKQEEIDDRKQDRNQRKKFSGHIFKFMCVYMAVALIIVFLCGLQVMVLDSSVLITLLSTTLANVIGVFTFVAKYLFHNK